MPKHRTYSTDFKRQIAQEYLGGETLHWLAKRHGISRNLIGEQLSLVLPQISLLISRPKASATHCNHTVNTGFCDEFKPEN